jgi:hypothetical protein
MSFLCLMEVRLEDAALDLLTKRVCGLHNAKPHGNGLGRGWGRQRKSIALQRQSRTGAFCVSLPRSRRAELSMVTYSEIR